MMITAASLLIFSGLFMLPLITKASENANETGKMLHFSHPMVVPDQESSAFDPRGMEHLYTITNLFLDLIQKEGIPKGILKEDIFKTPVRVLEENKSELISHFLGMLLVAGFGVVLAIVLPISGLLLCCCRCAGKCGSKKNVPEQRRDSCRRIIWGIIMFLILLTMMFGVVCAFVTNEYIEHGVQALPQNLRHNIGGFKLYLNNTQSEINHLLKKNFQQLQSKLSETLDNSGNTVKDGLQEVAKATAVNNLTEIVSRLERVQNQLRKAVLYTEELKETSHQLQLELTEIKNSLYDLKEECTSSVCQEKLKQYDKSAFSVSTNVYNFPNLSSVVHNISSLLSQNIEKEIEEGKLAFDKLSDTIQKAVNKTIPDIKHKISRVGSDLSTTAENITASLEFPQLEQAENHVTRLEPYLNKYSRYRWYAGIGFCCGMLSVVMCFACGLICGACGQQPGSIYSDNTCNKGAGADFLLLGVALLFLFSLFLAVGVTALFLIGGISERVVCDMVASSNPQLQQLIVSVQKYTGSSTREDNFDYIDTLQRCHNNQSLYYALGLDKHEQIKIGPRVIRMMKFSAVRNYRQDYQVDQKLEEFLHQLNISPNVTVLTPQGEELLQRLKDTPLSGINFSSYFHVDKQITSINLLDAADQLKETVSLISPSEHRIKEKLLSISAQLENCHNSKVLPALEKLDQLQEIGKQVQKDIRFGNKTIQEALPDLLSQAQQAQEFLQTKGKEEIKRLAEDFISEFTGLMDQYTSYVEKQVKDQIGKCGPVSQAFNATVVATCSEILLPFNGFWASLGSCIILCIPGLIVAVILSVLYRRVEPYPGPLVDSEYNSDSYVDRDNIPLAHVNRKHGDRQIYENRNGYIHDYSPGYQEASVSYLPGHAGGDFARDTGTSEAAAFINYQPLHQLSTRTTPSAPTSVEFSSADDYAKPPPYYFPGP